jgi:hypothetical protein
LLSAWVRASINASAARALTMSSQPIDVGRTHDRATGALIVGCG